MRESTNRQSPSPAQQFEDWVVAPPSLGKKFRRTNYCRRKELVTKEWQIRARPRASIARRSAKGWTPERRAGQAERIRLWQPWRESTGPRRTSARRAWRRTRSPWLSRPCMAAARPRIVCISLCANTCSGARPDCGCLALRKRRGRGTSVLCSVIEEGRTSGTASVAGAGSLRNNRTLRGCMERSPKSWC